MSVFTHWGQRISTEETNNVLSRIALFHLSRINSSEARGDLQNLLDSGDILGICNYRLDYGSLSVWDAINIRQILAFFQKRADVDVGIDRREVAKAKFIASEERCRETNEIFRLRADGLFRFSPAVESILHTSQRKIASMLGDVPDLSCLKLRFGPGATTQIRKRNASARRKLGMTHACSEDLLPLLKEVLEEMPLWIFGESTGDPEGTAVVDVEIHRGRVNFVLKNFKEHRSIVIEPPLNVMVQLGVNDHLVDRFKKFGVDLKDQSTNRRLAREGSITGALATLDQTNASSLIATLLVYDQLPFDWAHFLDMIRTSNVVLDGECMKLSMFSSMGNGFTFPLESLIFYALAYACAGEDSDKVSIFGDDLIVPVDCVPLVTEVFNAVGFIINSEKSYASGRFRESCGGDYLSGIDIRPIYIKDSLVGCDMFKLHNGYVRRDDHEAAAQVLQFIHPTLQKWGPDGYGDGHLIGDYPRCRHNGDRGWSGHVFETYTWKAKKEFAKYLPGDRVLPFYCSYMKSDLMRGISFEEDTFGAVTESISDFSYKNGRLGVSIPGRDSVNLIKIYVL